MKRYVIAVAMSAALLMVPACSANTDTGGSSGGSQGGAIKVGTLLSVTGPAANLGDKMRKGLQLAIDEINGAGGIDGRKIDWTFYDPAGDTSKAAAQTRKLLTTDHVDVVVGGGSQSGIALAMGQQTAANGTLFMATEGAKEIVAPASEHPLTFKSTFNDNVMIERTIAFWKARGITKVGFMPDTSGFGQSAKTAMEALAPAAGISVSTEAFDPGATDLTPQISKLLANEPQALLAWTTTPAGVVFLKNAKQLVGDRNILLEHGFGFVDDRYMTQAGAASVGTILSSPKLPVGDLLPAADPQKATIAKFVADFKAKYNEEPNVYAGQTYDAMKLVAQAIKQAGTTDGKAVAKALEGITNYVGVTGQFAYSNSDHSGLTAKSVAMIDWDGSRFVIAKE